MSKEALQYCKCGRDLVCPSCDAYEPKPRALTEKGWTMLHNRTARRPGQIYPDTTIQVGDKKVIITGLIADVKVIDAEESS